MFMYINTNTKPQTLAEGKGFRGAYDKLQAVFWPTLKVHLISKFSFLNGSVVLLLTFKG